MKFLRDDIDRLRNDLVVKQARNAQDEQGKLLRLTEELRAASKTHAQLAQQPRNQRGNIDREDKALKALAARGVFALRQ